MPRYRDGFSMIEIVVALAIVAVLATLAMPSFQGSIVRDQIVSAVPLADIASTTVALVEEPYEVDASAKEAVVDQEAIP